MTIRRSSIALSMSIVALISLSAGLTQTANAQNTATAPASSAPAQSVASADPVATAVAAVNPDETVKAQIDAIRAKYKQERDALSPATSADTAAGRPSWTPEQREQLAASEVKEVAEIKATLPAEQQAKFQSAYDAAKLAQASAPILALLSEKLALTEDEKTKVTPIVAEYVGQSQKLRQDSTLDRDARREKQTALWDATKAKIRPLLTSEKQTTLDGITPPRGGRPGTNGGGAPAGTPKPQ